MNDAYVTFQGWVGTDVSYRQAGTGWVASFRVACTPRFRRNGEWVDGETVWFTVNAWRSLGRNVSDSLRKGEPVIVHGKLRTDVWTREDGQTSVTQIVDATFVGHDLAKGTSVFTRVQAAATEPDQDADELREVNHSYATAAPQVPSNGFAA